MNICGSQPRIAFLSPGLGGGIGRVLVNLGNAFVERGVSVDLLLSKLDSPYLQQLSPQVRVIRLPTTHPVSGLPALVGYLRRERPLSINTDSIRVNVLALRARSLAQLSSREPLRVCATLHNTYSRTLATRSPAKRSSQLARLRRFYPRNDAVIAVSRGVAEDFLDLAPLHPSRLHVIPNPVVTPEIERLAALDPAHPWLAPGQPPLLLAVGRLHPQKDYPTLLRACAALPATAEWRLLILGEGEERPYLEQLIGELGLTGRVALGGEVDNPYAYMARASLLVLSSAWEGFGNVLVEAMAVGTPVVATDCPHGPGEILDKGRFGTLVPVGDAGTLAVAISGALARPAMAPEVLRAATEPYRVATVVEQYARLLLPHERLAP